MASKMKIKICVVWEHELRMAAQSLHNLNEVVKEMEQVVNRTSEQQKEIVIRYGVAAQSALRACMAALYGCADEESAITISSAPKLRRR